MQICENSLQQYRNDPIIYKMVHLFISEGDYLAVILHLFELGYAFGKIWTALEVAIAIEQKGQP